MTAKTPDTEEENGKKHKGGYMQINKSLNIGAFEDYLEAQLSHLPAIADVERISPRVIRVLGQNAGKFTLQGTNTYIVGTGSERLLIDTGQGVPEYASLLSATLSAQGTRLSLVLLSHWHGDHVGGVPDILRLYPELADSIYKNSPSGNQQPILDGQEFKVQGATVYAIHAPGHSHDHMCFYLKEDNAMFTGDNILGHGTAAVEQLSSWMASLQIMKSYNCETGYPAHGVVVPDLPQKIDIELSVKKKRETQVLQALRAIAANSSKEKPSATIQELVAKTHGSGLDEQVRLKAVQPLMEEVLRKLAEDQKVAFQIRNGRKRWYELPQKEGSIAA